MKIKVLKQKYPENMKKLWEPFVSYLLNSSQDIFRFNILIFIYFFKYKTIEIHARAFLPLNNISAVSR